MTPKASILVIGSNGMLGCDMTNQQNVSIRGIDFPEIDITKSKETLEIISNLSPSLIINCAAYTAVDTAEEKKDLAFQINANGAENLVESAMTLDIPICHFSTDYVFDGNGNAPYIETDTPNPKNVYGKSKLEGEHFVRQYPKHFIIRTSWLFGKNGTNFVTTMIKLMKEKGSLNVVSDQFGSPTFTKDLVKQTMFICTHLPYGSYHVTNSGSTTWFEFAKTIQQIMNIPSCQINPILSKEYPTLATRPLYSILSNQKSIDLGAPPMPHWLDALKEYCYE